MHTVNLDSFLHSATVLLEQMKIIECLPYKRTLKQSTYYPVIIVFKNVKIFLYIFKSFDRNLSFFYLTDEYGKKFIHSSRQCVAISCRLLLLTSYRNRDNNIRDHRNLTNIHPTLLQRYDWFTKRSSAHPNPWKYPSARRYGSRKSSSFIQEIW